MKVLKRGEKEGAHLLLALSLKTGLALSVCCAVPPAASPSTVDAEGPRSITSAATSASKVPSTGYWFLATKSIESARYTSIMLFKPPSARFSSRFNRRSSCDSTFFSAFSMSFLRFQVCCANSDACSSLSTSKTLSNRIPPDMVHTSMAAPRIGARLLAGCSSVKKVGLAICLGPHSPTYEGLSIMGWYHLPLYSGLSVVGGVHRPHPGTAAHFGFSTIGASQSPSSSSSQS
mmetsp:Transcript_57412/g.115240  ORF Transcript_57412/g.115240 Transcript_57412/m.115240 type:complete len:232 (-) Transcript_57412:352-1047(-)